ncbi:MAG: hypothetical protein GWN58_07390 [Anaerolineae bacterium]|nr:hypothetical protein [Anaerolineae bacterium]
MPYYKEAFAITVRTPSHRPLTLFEAILVAGMLYYRAKHEFDGMSVVKHERAVDEAGEPQADSVTVYFVKNEFAWP